MNYLFADTANLAEIIEANDMGAIQGVTTNPSIIAKEPKGGFEDLIQKLAEYCGSENLSLSAEVFALDYDGMVRQANELYAKFQPICDQFHVKIPVGFDGLRAIKTASKSGVRINATACYTEQQLQMCASAGAHYVYRRLPMWQLGRRGLLRYHIHCQGQYRSRSTLWSDCDLRKRDSLIGVPGVVAFLPQAPLLTCTHNLGVDTLADWLYNTYLHTQKGWLI